MRLTPGPPFPLPSSLVVMACAAWAWCVVSVGDAVGMSRWAAALFSCAALPVLFRHFERVQFYARVARLMEQRAQRNTRPCVLCERKPVVVSRAMGASGYATVTCACGITLTIQAKATQPTPAFQLRVMTVERAVLRWNSDDYRQGVRDASANTLHA